MLFTEYSLVSENSRILKSGLNTAICPHPFLVLEMLSWLDFFRIKLVWHENTHIKNCNIDISYLIYHIVLLRLFEFKSPSSCFSTVFFVKRTLIFKILEYNYFQTYLT